MEAKTNESDNTACCNSNIGVDHAAQAGASLESYRSKSSGVGPRSNSDLKGHEIELAPFGFFDSEGNRHPGIRAAWFPNDEGLDGRTLRKAE